MAVQRKRCPVDEIDSESSSLAFAVPVYPAYVLDESGLDKAARDAQRRDERYMASLRRYAKFVRERLQNEDCKTKSDARKGGKNRGDSATAQSYSTRAANIVRNNLCLFSEDGSASCAFVYPRRVNGTPAHYADAFANDQDWALVFYLAIAPSR